MPELQVVINHYGEADMLREALDSVTTVVPEASVLVLDGRYANFYYGEDDTTRGSEDLCRLYEGVSYRSPPDDALPFGEGLSGRRPIYDKAEWVWYEQADAGTWSLKLDDDERLRRFDVDLSNLDRREKHVATIGMPDDVITIPRLWVPEEWTFFVDDLCFPRDEFPRSLSFEALRDDLGPEATWTRVGYTTADDVQIVNRGENRSTAYRVERDQQKEEF